MPKERDNKLFFCPGQLCLCSLIFSLPFFFSVSACICSICAKDNFVATDTNTVNLFYDLFNAHIVKPNEMCGNEIQ